MTVSWEYICKAGRTLPDTRHKTKSKQIVETVETLEDLNHILKKFKDFEISYLSSGGTTQYSGFKTGGISNNFRFPSEVYHILSEEVDHMNSRVKQRITELRDKHQAFLDEVDND